MTFFYICIIVCFLKCINILLWDFSQLWTILFHLFVSLDFNFWPVFLHLSIGLPFFLMPTLVYFHLEFFLETLVCSNFLLKKVMILNMFVYDSHFLKIFFSNWWTRLLWFSYFKVGKDLSGNLSLLFQVSCDTIEGNPHFPNYVYYCLHMLLQFVIYTGVYLIVIKTLKIKKKNIP